MYHTVLVPTDGTAHAMWAAEQAVNLAMDHDATLHALYVVDTRRYGEPALSTTELTTDELEDQGNQALDRVVELATTRGVDAVSRLTHGPPPEAICEYASAIGADVVVLGVRGRRGDDKPMGDVAHHVLNRADTDVLTLTPDRVDISHPV